VRGLLIQTCLPTYWPGIRLYHVFGMACHTPIVRFGGARRHQFSVGGAAAGADPFGSGGGNAHLLCRSSSGSQLLQGPANELRRLGRSSGCKRSSNRIIGGRYPVAQAHQGLNRIL
jgi:hypothetical protein